MNDADHKAALAFEDWVRTEADDKVLECRVGRHRWPGLLSKKTKVDEVEGRVIIEHKCERHCGVSLVKMLGTDGILERSVQKYAYPKNRQGESPYLLPRAARSGHALTREQNGLMRMELLARRGKG